jgi:carbamoyltransferase
VLILGVNNGLDAGVALIEDGRVLAAVNEERLNRKKMFWGPPLFALEEVLRVADVDPAAIDFVAQSSVTGGGGVHDEFLDPPTIKKIVELVSLFPLTHSPLVKHAYRAFSGRRRKDEVVDARLHELGIRSPKRFIEHHHCHAATAYYCSPFGDVPEDVLVVTADGVGDGVCHSTNVVDKRHRIVRRQESMIFESIAEIYAYVTHNLGFRYNRHEGKITGLAAYGRPEKTIEIFRRVMGWDPERLELRARLPWGRPGARKLHRMLQGFKREDIAAGLQRCLEEVMAGLVGAGMARHRKRLLCAAGGLFSNVRLNQVLREIPGVEDIYIHPGMGDCGQGLGAALGLWAELEDAPKPRVLRDVYLGPSYGDDEIERALRSQGIAYHRSPDVQRETADLLARKRVVARFVGRMEYGPRALGHRSIYFHAADRTVNQWLNERLQRTEFMPFAPIVLKERATEFFRNFDPERSVAARFMTITYGATPKGLAQAPAAIHVDATARPQTVTAEDNPDAYAVIKAYEALTGVPILINTSFNMHEEPIVCTPLDAVRAFLQGRIDALAIGDFVALHPDAHAAARD